MHIFVLIFCLFIGQYSPLFAESDSYDKNNLPAFLESYHFKAEIPPNTKLSELDSSPDNLSIRIEDDDRWEDALFSLTDSHALLPIPPNLIIPHLINHAGEADIYPRMAMSRDLDPRLSMLKAHRQEVRMEFTFIGIGARYHYVVLRQPVFFHDGSFLICWKLQNSLDDSFHELFGSWYVEPVQGEHGETYSYLRNYVRTVLNDPIPGTATTMKLFGKGDLRAFYKALFKASRLD